VRDPDRGLRRLARVRDGRRLTVAAPAEVNAAGRVRSTGRAARRGWGRRRRRRYGV
jgi:hypothetical protein